MTYLSKVGSFNINSALTATQTQAITGVGFQPKIILLWWGGSVATGDSVGSGVVRAGFGSAIDATTRFCLSIFSNDAVATSAALRVTRSDQCIYILNSAGTADGTADLSSMDADGFTLVIDTQFLANYRISYLALGGTDLTNVYIGTRATPTATGNFSTTAPGFQPDAVIFATTTNTALNGAGNDAELSIGIATSSSAQGVVALFEDDANATSTTSAYGYNGEILARAGAAAISLRDAFVSMDATGFTLNQLEGTSARQFAYICLKGGQYSVGSLTTRTDGNDIAVTAPGFQPKALLFLSTNRALSTQDTPTANARLSIGAATSASERSCAAISDENNLADTETAVANYDSAVYANVVDDAAAGLMDIKSIDASGFTAVMDDTDPSGCWVTYLAIGATPAAGPVIPVFMNQYRQRAA